MERQQGRRLGGLQLLSARFLRVERRGWRPALSLPFARAEMRGPLQSLPWRTGVCRTAPNSDNVQASAGDGSTQAMSKPTHAPRSHFQAWVASCQSVDRLIAPRFLVHSRSTLLIVSFHLFQRGQRKRMMSQIEKQSHFHPFRTGNALGCRTLAPGANKRKGIQRASQDQTRPMADYRQPGPRKSWPNPAEPCGQQGLSLAHKVGVTDYG